MKTNLENIPARAARAILISVFVLAAAACDDKKTGKAPEGAPAASTGGPPATEAGAKELLSAFLKPGADVKSLSQNLRPSKADYSTVFTDEFAAKLAALYDPAWESGALVLKPNEGQTELLLRAVPSAEIKAWSKTASDDLPGGYEKIKDHFRDGHTIYAFKFVKPGETLGMAYDGLVHVNGHWRIFPKPFRAAQ
jgi:hypothetical protein